MIVFLWEAALILLFLIMMYAMRFFKAGEISAITKLWNRREVKGSDDISARI
jgi:hypothetical protein